MSSMAPARAAQAVRLVGLPPDEETAVLAVDVNGQSCLQAAALYTIQNQNREPVMESRMVEAYSAAPAPDSDFLRAVSNVDPARAWEVMDELMDSLKVVNERVYNSVMRKLES